MRTIPNIEHLLQPIEDIIRHKFIPAICENRMCSDDDRLLLSLPVRLGGLGITNIVSISDLEYDFSNKITKKMQNNIENQLTIYNKSTYQLDPIPQSLKDIKTKKDVLNKSNLNLLREKMTLTQLKANDIAQTDGASSWLTTLPNKR